MPTQDERRAVKERAARIAEERRILANPCPRCKVAAGTDCPLGGDALSFTDTAVYHLARREAADLTTPRPSRTKRITWRAGGSRG